VAGDALRAVPSVDDGLRNPVVRNGRELGRGRHAEILEQRIELGHRHVIGLADEGLDGGIDQRPVGP
jgi:hypothetical protein